MKTETFNVIWTECFEKAGIDLLNVFPEQLREKYKWRCDFSDKKRDEVLDNYTQNRNSLRKNFFYGQDNPEKLIDIHKIGACFEKAVIDAAPMSFIADEKTPWIINVSNYAAAFYSSVNMISFFLLAYYRKVNMDYYNKYKEQKIVSYPATTIGHDPYTIGRIKALALDDIMEVDFDYLSYADMLFWIEHYNRQVIESSVFVKPMESRI
ncbi:MAG: hypothetical protein IJ682_04420 [Lachnospiraceae bacterium]|nr:hypothetical protein [Lachnospiraceae bacterium]